MDTKGSLMNNEDLFILEQFQTNFILGQSKKIIIYGTGVHTEELLSNLENKNQIIGLMDNAKTGQVLFGIRVLSYEEVESLENVVIVIIARKSVESIIYRRIERFVLNNGIPVYSINGTEIKSDILNKTPKKCFMLNKNDLIAKIDSANTVSFDIFDTLVCRMVLRPIDVFRLVDVSEINISFDFQEERIKAESEVTTDNYDIDDIYNQMQKNTGISDYIKEVLKKEEYEAEKKVLCARGEMIKILQYALGKGKKVYLISDMYWNKRYLVALLDLMGIKGYSELIVSTDYKTSKNEKLFEKVRAKFNLNTSKWIHIGDNAFSDIQCADVLGIHTYKVYSTIEMLEESIYSKLIDGNLDIQENVIVSRYAAIAYNNPFGNYEPNGKLNIEGDENVVKLLIVPLIYKYISWLIKMVKLHNEELVIFPSRDGFLLRRIYEGMRFFDSNIPPSIYFYTSRRAAMTAAVKCEDDVLKELSVPDGRNICEIIKARFDVNVENIESIDFIDEKIMDNLIISANQEAAGLKISADKLGMLRYKNVAFVDFVASGTVQKYLQESLSKRFHGYYFVKRNITDNSYDKLLVTSLYHNKAGMNDFSSDINIYKYYYFLENIITSTEPSFMKYDKEGNKKFYDENRTVQQIEHINKIHKIIEEECIKLLNIIGTQITTDNNVDIYDQILGFFSSDYTNITDAEIMKIKNIDEFMGKEVSELNR